MNEQPPRPESGEFSEEERLLIETTRRTPPEAFHGSDAEKLLIGALE
jgi:hypothetical protein